MVAAGGLDAGQGEAVVAVIQRGRGHWVQLNRITGLILIQKASSVPSSKVNVTSIGAEDRDGRLKTEMEAQQEEHIRRR